MNSTDKTLVDAINIIKLRENEIIQARTELRAAHKFLTESKDDELTTEQNALKNDLIDKIETYNLSFSEVTQFGRKRKALAMD